MRIVFMGTPDFAVESLKKLVEEGHEICAVYTQPDKPKNRGMKLLPTPVKEYALTQNLPVYQPERLVETEEVEQLRALQPELIVAAAYGQLLSEEVLTIPPMGCINVHSSLLPKYRGAAPINWAILNGDAQTGVSIMYMVKQLDAGDVICTRATDIDPQENALQLTQRLAVLGGEALAEAIRSLQNGTATRTVQEESLVTYAEKLSKELSPVCWNDPAQKICNQIRGLIPWPCASAQVQDKEFKLFAAHPGKKTAAAAGTLLAADKNGIEVACGDGMSLVITELQENGGKRMAAADYLRGHPMQV